MRNLPRRLAMVLLILGLALLFVVEGLLPWYLETRIPRWAAESGLPGLRCEVRRVGLTGADIRNLVNEAALWATRSGKDAVDQLTTAAAREFSGTYASRFVVVAQPIDASYKALARALNVRVIELPGAAGRRRLERQHITRLRQALHEVLPLPVGASAEAVLA